MMEKQNKRSYRFHKTFFLRAGASILSLQNLPWMCRVADFSYFV